MESVSRPLSASAPDSFQWGPVIGGALAATALSFILLSFGSAIGLSIASTSPSWRDASAALALLSGLYLILQAVISFGVGGYVAGRSRIAVSAEPDSLERRDGTHGLLAWALAIVIGAGLAAWIGAAAASRAPATSPQASAAEPLLSYEIDRLLRAPRRAPDANLAPARAEIGRVLLTSAGHSGVAAEDRAFLVQQTATLTGAADAERRVDEALGRSRQAIRKSRQTAVILSFSAAAAALLGAVAAWAAAVAGGRHRDGEPLPHWMGHGDRWTRPRHLPTSARRPVDPVPGSMPE
jgi:hypothetical protein